MVNYKGIDVYKYATMDTRPCDASGRLNMLENFDLKAMGFNSARYIHTLYQVHELSFADRDFYYGDPYFAPEEPIKGLLSKGYAKEESKLLIGNVMILKLHQVILILSRKVNPYKII